MVQVASARLPLLPPPARRFLSHLPLPCAAAAVVVPLSLSWWLCGCVCRKKRVEEVYLAARMRPSTVFRWILGGGDSVDPSHGTPRGDIPAQRTEHPQSCFVVHPGRVEMLPTGVVGQVIHDHENKRPKKREQLGKCS